MLYLCICVFSLLEFTSFHALQNLTRFFSLFLSIFFFSFSFFFLRQTERIQGIRILPFYSLHLTCTNFSTAVLHTGTILHKHARTLTHTHKYIFYFILYFLFPLAVAEAVTFSQPCCAKFLAEILQIIWFKTL